ncbi:glycosyl transferase, family 2 [Legionella erythra]|uniref:Glycosyl transferase, family 2 n=2 Tax=Legionella erythra TaxID=448 RepID=A0A0W0TRC4_LEGER|nr:glycosyl transferase, family 2 [Legionella erythra]
MQSQDVYNLYNHFVAIVMPDAQCHYSIIIPAYNEEAYLPMTLHSVNAATWSIPHLKGEVIVVNNDSSDKTAEIAENFGARVILEPMRNIARVRNTGAHQARGELLIFLDADTLMTTEMLDTSLAILHDPEIIAGSFLLKPDRPVSRLMQLMFTIWNNYSRWYIRCAGSFLFCKKNAFEATGGFDERYFVTEDISLSIQLKRYARRQQKRVVIYNKYVEMSLRKIDQHPLSARLVVDFLSGLFFRSQYKQKKNCKYWY